MDWETLRAAAVRTWNYVLLDFKAHEPLIVKQLVIGCSIFLTGYIVARIVRWRMAVALDAMESISPHNAKMLERGVFLLLLFVSLATAVEVVHIPMSAFSFLAGGLAVGVGFGSRNILNNLFSGVILIFERPVRIGNIVEIDGTLGTIESIGLRATRLRTEHHTHVFIPNSVILQTSVENWAFMKETLTACIEVGLAYETDVARATELMIEAVRETQVVETEAAPFVHFAEYQESVLLFKVFFEIRAMDLQDRFAKESRVRYALLERLTAAGVKFAYPQRDIHLDAPLQVALART